LFFFIKDQATKNTILKGRCHKGLYPLPPAPIKQAFGVDKPSLARWHSRLGHPSFPIVTRVVNSNSLPCLAESNKQSVCDACQQAKSHQLPYPRSSSVSSHPLELIFSDVWGPAPNSVGGKNYYVSFIDDYNKFTWIYLLKFKSGVFQKFNEFQGLVERLFNQKIIAIQTDWGGEYQKLHSLFEKVGITHYVSCPHAHQQNGSAERKHRHIVEVGLALLAHYNMTPPSATQICVAKSLYMRWQDLYQRISYVLLKVALQGSIATLIYPLVTHTNNHCKVATHNDSLWQHLHVFVQTIDELLLCLLQHIDLLCCNTYMRCKE
jgi:hypothetical protein